MSGFKPVVEKKAEAVGVKVSTSGVFGSSVSTSETDASKQAEVVVAKGPNVHV